MIIPTLKALFALDGGIIIFGILQNDIPWILNSQLAFASSLFITASTLYSYRKHILNNQLLTETQPPQEESDDNDKEKEILWRTKLISGIKSFSPLRLLGYTFLIITFLILNQKHLFDPIAFLVGLASVPLSTFIATYHLKKSLESNHDNHP